MEPETQPTGMTIINPTDNTVNNVTIDINNK